MIRSHHLWAMVLATCGAAGCAHVPVQEPVVWPPPPEVARIRFERSFSRTTDLDTSLASQLGRALVGGSDDPSLKQPMGLALSADGTRLYIADYGLAQVLVADFTARTVKPFPSRESMGRVFGVALDADESLYVSVSSPPRVDVYARGGKLLRSFGAGDLERPTGIAIDRARRRVIVVDGSRHGSNRHRVLAYDLAGTKLFEVGRGLGSDDGQFLFPSYVAVDGDGRIYVADTMNFRLQVFDADGRFVRKYGENGDGPGHFSRVKGLAFDGFGNLYVVDSGHSVVQIFNRDLQALMFFGGYANLLEYFDIPSGIAIDPRTNRIYVCNESVARINAYQLVNTKAEDSFAPGPARAEAKP